MTASPFNPECPVLTNQLTADGTRTFTYDGAGNRTDAGYRTGSANQLTNDGVWTYTYDAEGKT
jgi:YD repeat-containing protein